MRCEFLESFEGSSAVAGRQCVIFPLPMTYTVQKSGAPFDTVLGMSFALNLFVKTTRLMLGF